MATISPVPPVRPESLRALVEQGQLTPAQAVARLSALRQGAPAGTQDDATRRAEQVMAELDALVGLAPVKRKVAEIRAFAVVQARRARAGLLNDAVSLHMLFTGNPGTGKTTVARLLGRLFKELGVLAKGHMVEVERADLVGEYIGHTAQRTREKLRAAQGGVLFIDEAYSLARGGEKDFGKEAIDCLVRGMEEQRGDMLLVLAGYPGEMAWFMAQNPGLGSRFALHIEFPDYGPQELLQIAQVMLQARQYTLAPDAREYLRTALASPRFLWHAGEGNARAVRNLVERVMRTQAVRLLDHPQAGRLELMNVTRADLQAAIDT